MKSICITGGDAPTRLACATRVGRALLGQGRTVALVSQWNRSGDPDPYMSSPFTELALVSAEASLSYSRPGMKLDNILSSVRSDWLVADGIELPESPRIACSPDSMDEATIGVFGFAWEGGPASLPAYDSELAAFLLERVEEKCARCPAPCGEQLDMHVTAASVSVGGVAMELGAFPARVLESTIMGLLSAFRGFETAGDIEISIRRQG
jgi:hypothetical protein